MALKNAKNSAPTTRNARENGEAEERHLAKIFE